MHQNNKLSLFIFFLTRFAPKTLKVPKLANDQFLGTFVLDLHLQHLDQAQTPVVRGCLVILAL